MKKYDIELFKNYVLCDKNDIVRIFLIYFPDLINLKFDSTSKDTIVHIELKKKNTELLTYLFSFDNLNWSLTNSDGVNYLEYLCLFDMFELLNIFCKKYNDALKITYENNKNIGIIENIILLNDFEFMTKTDIDNLKKIILILISNGANINHYNDKKYIPLFCCIQYGSLDFVKFMIANGSNINMPLNRNEEFPPISNNDPVSFAIQVNRFDVVKLLINNKASLHKITLGELRIYTSILISIKYSRDEIFNYLINLDEIKKWILQCKLIKDYLFNYAVNNCCCFNNDILKHIAPEFKIESLNLTNPTIHFSQIEKKIIINIPKYKNLDETEKLFILNGLADTIGIILKIKNIKWSNYLEIYNEYCELIDLIKYNLHTNKNIYSIGHSENNWTCTFINVICEKI